MRVHIVFILAVIASACSSKTTDRTHTLQGQILQIDAPNKQVVVKHEEIKGLMPAMTMPYSVRDTKLLNGLAAGDLIDASLVVESNDAYLRTIRKVGEAPLEKPPVDTATAPAPRSGVELLKNGDAVPDAPFVDQDGKKRSFGAFRGSPVVMTFIYTRCPLATFCPLMDRHFAAMQRPLKDDPALHNIHLVTVSFDPKTDTPPVLKKHAKTLNADLSRWTFLTGDRDEVDRFAMRFGVSIARAMNDPRDITHNLRTVIIGADGRLVKVYTGNDWTPEQVLADLKHVG
ncbi:MAG TPA: SCO family protein [Vicinamibacterales bacterium]|jgi:protein SCO1/2|nr:SCO family protein [Vicinamibacterales bacterium]